MARTKMGEKMGTKKYTFRRKNMKITIKNAEGNLIKSVDADAKKTLLSQLEAQAVEIPNACRAGMCAACMCTIEKGEEYILKDFRGEPAFPLGDDEVMTCIGGLKDIEDGEIILKTMY